MMIVIKDKVSRGEKCERRPGGEISVASVSFIYQSFFSIVHCRILRALLVLLPLVLGSFFLFFLFFSWYFQSEETPRAGNGMWNGRESSSRGEPEENGTCRRPGKKKCGPLERRERSQHPGGGRRRRRDKNFLRGFSAESASSKHPDGGETLLFSFSFFFSKKKLFVPSLLTPRKKKYIYNIRRKMQ